MDIADYIGSRERLMQMDEEPLFGTENRCESGITRIHRRVLRVDSQIRGSHGRPLSQACFS